MSPLLTDTTGWAEAGYDPETIRDAEARNAAMRRFLSSPLGPHLEAVTDGEGEEVGGGFLLSATEIAEETAPGTTGADLLARGYLPVWNDGGDLIVYGVEEAAFFLAEHTFEDRVVRLSDDPPETFFAKLRDHDQNLGGRLP